MKNLLLAILAIVCLLTASDTNACETCSARSSTSTTTYVCESFRYAFVARPVYTVRFVFNKCDQTCSVPVPEPKCEVWDRGLVKYTTDLCACGCRMEFRDNYGNVWRTDAKVDSMPDEVVGWLYTVTKSDGTEHSYLQEAARKGGEWKPTDRRWYFVGK